MLPQLAKQIIETYSQPGDLILDPMSGIGTTGVEALWLGRRYLGIEIEAEFADIQLKSMEVAVSQGAPGTDYEVICADAAQQQGICDVDLVAFSPPYQDAVHNQGKELERIARKIQNGSASPEMVRRFGNWDSNTEQAQAGLRPSGYSVNTHNAGHFQGKKYWQVMETIFTKSFEAVRPGGYLVVVTKDQRDRKTGELTNLYGETVTLCRELGFQLHQHNVALLCHLDGETGAIKPRTSHWQRMAIPKAMEKGKINLVGQFEDVIVFRKPGL